MKRYVLVLFLLLALLTLAPRTAALPLGAGDLDAELLMERPLRSGEVLMRLQIANTTDMPGTIELHVSATPSGDVIRAASPCVVEHASGTATCHLSLKALGTRTLTLTVRSDAEPAGLLVLTDQKAPVFPKPE